MSCDLMHDMLERICRYEAAYFLDYFIHKKKYFSLERLNDRITFFQASAPSDIECSIPKIKSDHLKTICIVMSASEMLALISYLGIIIGDLIPEDDTCWEIYILLHQILMLLLDAIFSHDSLNYLKIIIEEHHDLFCQHSGMTLKPKHHFLVHYPSLISKIGPVRFLWSMRYEAFHKLLKSTANSITSRKNILLTLAKKQQLRFSFRILSESGFFNNIDFSPIWDDLRSLPEYNIIVELLTKEGYFIEDNPYFSVRWAKCNNTTYKLGMVLGTSDNNEYDIPSFAAIKYIIIVSNHIIYFVCTSLNVIKFNSHVQCYEVDENSHFLTILTPSLLRDQKPKIAFRTFNGTKMILTT